MTSRYFGKCLVKGCKTFRVTDTNEVHTEERGYYLHHWQYEGTAERRKFFGILAGRDLVCDDHKRFLDWSPLNVKPVNPEKNCDTRCMNAKRSGCDCPCRGRNHGANNLTSVQ